MKVSNLGSLLRDRCPDGEWNILHLAIDQPPTAAPPSFYRPIAARRRPASRVSGRSIPKSLGRAKKPLPIRLVNAVQFRRERGFKKFPYHRSRRSFNEVAVNVAKSTIDFECFGFSIKQSPTRQLPEMIRVVKERLAKELE
jgi:hypothetical protein